MDQPNQLTSEHPISYGPKIRRTGKLCIYIDNVFLSLLNITESPSQTRRDDGDEDGGGEGNEEAEEGDDTTAGWWWRGWWRVTISLNRQQELMVTNTNKEEKQIMCNTYVCRLLMRKWTVCFMYNCTYIFILTNLFFIY